MNSVGSPRKHSPWVVMVLTAFALITHGRAGFAEPTPEEKALGTQLFQDGRALMLAGQVDRACAKLEESQRLDPGGGTLLNVALCHELQGRTASAWAEYNAALALARRDHRQDRIDFATEHLAAVEKKLSRLTVILAPERRHEGLTITRNGSPLPPAVWNEPTVVDPGRQRIVVNAPGFVEWSGEVIVGPNADLGKIEIPDLVAVTTQPKPAASSQPPAATASVTPPAIALGPRPVDASWTKRETSGVGAMVIGVAALGVGAYFGLDALSTDRRSRQLCPTSTTCTAEGSSLSHDATRSADMSTLVIGLGVIGVGLGSFLYFGAPAHSTEPRNARLVPIRVGTANGAGILTTW